MWVVDRYDHSWGGNHLNDDRRESHCLPSRDYFNEELHPYSGWGTLLSELASSERFADGEQRHLYTAAFLGIWTSSDVWEIPAYQSGMAFLSKT